jgi:DNA replication licensing factor MCM6
MNFQKERMAPLRDSLAEEVGRLFFGFLGYFDPHLKEISQETPVFLDYRRQIAVMIRQDSRTIYIDFEHLIQYNEELADVIEEQYSRMEPYINESIFQFIKKFYLYFAYKSGSRNEFWASFYNLPEIRNINSLKFESSGRLLSIVGIITRISDPYVELAFGTFECTNENCKYKIIRVEQRFLYSEPKICTNCGNQNSWNLVIEDSIFSSFQKIRIQEIPSQKPFEYFPITIELFLKEDNVNLVRIGDRCIFSGTGVILPFSKISNQFPPALNKAKYSENEFLGGSSDKINYKIKFVVSHLLFLNIYNDLKFKKKKKKKNYEKKQKFFSRKEREIILKIRSKKNLSRILFSYFEIEKEQFGKLKISLLLMILGGVEKILNNKEMVRGNINILIKGFSRAHKTGMFKNLIKFLPRSIFLNGNSTSKAGIVASVLWDHRASCFCIEAGAFILANKGFCFFDNFDKIKFGDQVSFHDITDQQFISIAKAGLRMKLKTKISILAMTSLNYKNPEKFSKKGFLNLENSRLFNRFDLFFEKDSLQSNLNDYKICQDIILSNTLVKKANLKKPNFFPMQLYISFAKLIKPKINSNSKKLILEIYIFLRKTCFIQSENDNVISIRKLETIIRISEAFCKIFLSLKIENFHVKAAARLLFVAIRIPKRFVEKNLMKVKKKSAKHIKIKNFFRKEEGNKDENSEFRVSISFKEFEKISKIIINFLIEKEKIGFTGTSLKKLLEYSFKKTFTWNKKKTGFTRLQKIFYTIKHLVIKQKLLTVISDSQKNPGKIYLIIL